DPSHTVPPDEIAGAAGHGLLIDRTHVGAALEDSPPALPPDGLVIPPAEDSWGAAERRDARRPRVGLARFLEDRFAGGGRRGDKGGRLRITRIQGTKQRL